MNATVIIPYLLAANLLDANWNHGPEYKFALDITVDSEGRDPMELYPGVNCTNEVLCRPKETDVLSCSFRHIEFDFFARNFTSGKTIRKTTDHRMSQNHESHRMRRHAGHEHSHIFNKLPFEVKFGKRGIESLVVSESSTTDVRLGIIKSAANLLNIGTDLTAGDLESEQIINFLTGKCLGEVHVSLDQRENDEGNDLLKNYKLQLIDPLPKLSGGELNVKRPIHLTKCTNPLKFLWAPVAIKDVDKDPNLKMVALDENMRITENKFVSEFLLSLETTKNNYPFGISEALKLYLTDITPATEEIPSIKNPTTVYVN